MLPFSISIVLLSLVQGALVAVPRAPALPRLARLRGQRRWALIPPASVIGFVFVTRAAERASADGLTYLALAAVPLLALALGLGGLARGDPTRDLPTRDLPGRGHPVQNGRPAAGALAWAWAALVAGLFALAWIDRGGLIGEASALSLSALSCATLGVLLAAVTPARWLAAGIVAMALADTALVVSDLLQQPNNALNAAHPAAGLPQLQSAVFGSAVMGYGDLFIAAVLGALLARAMGRRWQLRGAALTALLGLAFDLLFFFVNELPATVPVALTLLALVVMNAKRKKQKMAEQESSAADQLSRSATSSRPTREADFRSGGTSGSYAARVVGVSAGSATGSTRTWRGGASF